MQNKLNLLVHFRAYADNCPSNSPSLNYTNWTRELSGIAVDRPISSSFTLAPNETYQIFNGARTLTQNGSTSYTLAPKVGTSNTFTLTYAGAGTAPNFRTLRSTTGNATTQIQVTVNGAQATYSVIGGTAMNFTSAGTQVGDSVFIGSGVFATPNQGVFSIIAFTDTSITIENTSAVAETQLLGSTYASQIQVYSAAGVQIGDNLLISAGFSAISQGAWEITAVYPQSVEFYSTIPLPAESNIVTQVAVYFDLKNFVYVESNANVQVSLNGSVAATINPWNLTTGTQPGQFMLKSSMWSCSIQNVSSTVATVYTACLE